MNIKQHQPNLLDVPISFFEYDNQRHSFANVPTHTTTLRRIVNTAYYRPIIDTIRSEPEKDKQNQLKRLLPAITPISLLYHRKRDTSFAQKIQHQWPLLMGDVDKKDNPDLDMAELKKHLSRLPYLLLCAYSVRGGLWFVVRLPDGQTPESLIDHFRYLQKLFSQKFGIVLDSTKGGNPTDLRFVSYDPAPFFNEQASVMSGTYTPPKPKPNFSRSLCQIEVKRPDREEVLNRLIRYLQGAAEGQRHERLLKAAKLAGGFVAAGQIDERTAIYALETVASEWPNFVKSQKTIQDGLRYGRLEPLNPSTSNNYVNIQQVEPHLNEKLLPTDKGYIGDLAVGSMKSPPLTERPKVKPDCQIIHSNVSEHGQCDTSLEILETTNETVSQLKISSPNFFEWQRQHKDFSRLGLRSLQLKSQ